MAESDSSKRGRHAIFWALLWGVLLAGILVSIPLWRMRIAMKQNRFDELILHAAGESGCDPSLVKAVIWRESHFDPTVHGKDGELGLMQVMPAVAIEWAQGRGLKDFNSNELLDPATNIRVGAWYLAKGIQQWVQASEPVPLALAQYNAGRSNVLKWVDAGSMADADHFIQRIQFPSTRSYVRDILEQYKTYRQRGEF